MVAQSRDAELFMVGFTGLRPGDSVGRNAETSAAKWARLGLHGKKSFVRCTGDAEKGSWLEMRAKPFGIGAKRAMQQACPVAWRTTR